VKIALLSDGLAPHSRRWANWFSDQGHIVRVFSFNHEDCGDYRENTIINLLAETERANSNRIVRSAKLLFRLRREIARFRPNIIHAHSATSYSWAAAALKTCPLVVTPWGTDIVIDVVESRTCRWLAMWSLLRADAVTTDGRHLLHPLEQLGVPRKKVLLHQFGTDTSFFRPDEIGRGTLITGNEVRIVSTRTPNPVHRVDLAIKALHILRKSDLKVHLSIVGGGKSLPELRELSRELGVDDSITYVGMVNEHGMLAQLRRADIYLSTSDVDAGLAASTAEAMSVGLPVVHTDNSDNREWVADGVGGMLFKGGDEESLAESLRKAISKRQLWREWGARNRSLVLKGYNRDIEMRKIESLYEALKMGRNSNISKPPLDSITNKVQ
jgi:glycosyltransferase involved in cell wall biosynthesis